LARALINHVLPVEMYIK